MLSLEAQPLAQAHQELLLGLARASIRHGLTEGTPLPVDLATLPPELRAVRATFVTLELGGELRGCMGRLEATRPLAHDIVDNAFAAAFLDTRFPPVAPGEVEGLHLHLSLLTAPEPLAFQSEDDLLAQLVPGRDGLIIEARGRRATFLPSVWASLPEPAAFLSHLQRKAGLEPGVAGLRAFRYLVEAVG